MADTPKKHEQTMQHITSNQKTKSYLYEQLEAKYLRYINYQVNLNEVGVIGETEEGHEDLDTDFREMTVSEALPQEDYNQESVLTLYH